MSLSPEPLPQPEFPPETPPGIPPQESQRRNRRRVIVGLFFALFAFEIGLFLVVFPWMDNWDLNYFEGVFPALRDTWNEPSFRGAVTGLGLINIYIAFLQIFYLIRRSRRS
ncbi:MAG TPA: hypothetical protein VN841_19825 [Bryobacteraceae bacterium]|nr:hypothetical protein [Bryobacteraceae bacterium]